VGGGDPAGTCARHQADGELGRPDARDAAPAAISPADRSLFPVLNTRTADEWPDLVSAARLARVPWADQLAAIRPVVAEIAALARAADQGPGDEVMTHGDVDQKNILLTADGPVLCDWDAAAPMIPACELADVAMSLAGWKQQEIGREAVRAYRAAGGPATGIRPCDLGQSLLSSLDWIALNIGRATGTQPAGPAEAAVGRRLVPGLLARLPHELEISRRADEFLAA
jgi:hypothetical protein